jgi:hypothetical protein
MVATVITFPRMVTGNVTEAATVKGTGEEELRRQLGLPAPGGAESAPPPAQSAPPPAQSAPRSDDPASEIERALREGK